MKAFGIDLGTTNSILSYYSKGAIVIVPIESQRLVPSVVYIDDKDGSMTVGQYAKRRILANPNQVLSSTKRFIGTNWTKTINGEKYTPIDSAREVLLYIKREAEKNLGERIENVVVTIPAYFNDKQREDTKKAAEEAGLNVLLLLPEPTAAAICHGFNKEKDQTILVVDLGGGTFDVSLLEVKNNNFEVKAIDGDSFLGGDDFDYAIVQFLNEWVLKNTGKDISKDAVIQQMLKENAEKIKIELSAAKSTDILISDHGIEIDINRFTVDQYKQLIQPYLGKIVEKIQNVLSAAKMGIDDINRVVLVGGSCKHPIIKELITQQFKTPFLDDDMDTSVSRGAAIVCHSLLAPTHADSVHFEDVIPQSLGIDMIVTELERRQFIPILRRNTKYPAKGVVRGFTMPGQKEAVMTVYRGEYIDQLERNNKLGILSLKIDSQGSEYPNMVAAIFNLDENCILTFTGVEILLNNEQILSDSLFQRIDQYADQNDGVILYGDIEQLIRKYSLRKEVVKIEVK